MSRSASAAATTAGQRTLPRPPAPHRPRRVSGPASPPRREPRARIDASVLAAPGAVAYPRPQRLPSRPPLRLVAGGAAIAYRVSDAALGVAGSRLMDRLVRSRVWIVVVAFALIGIVAMQVSMLKLNAGVGRAVETISTLERTNASMRAEVSRLSSGDRIQSLAGARGFVMPAPADVTYLRARDARADATRAAGRMIAPDRELAGPAGAPVPTAPVITATPEQTAAGAAPAAAAAPTGATTPAAPATTAAAPVTTPPATTPGGTTAAPVQAATPPAPPAAAPVTTASSSGGVAPPTGATGATGG
jgi:cell division protein FtsB